MRVSNSLKEKQTHPSIIRILFFLFRVIGGVYWSLSGKSGVYILDKRGGFYFFIFIFLRVSHV